MPDQIPPSDKEHRSKVLNTIAEKLKATFREGYIGKTLEVLIERRVEGLWEGHTRNYIPVRVAHE